MSYTPTNWQTGDTITAERLNKLEAGVVAASNLFAELSPIVVDGTEYQNIFVIIDETQKMCGGFTTDSDITKIIGHYSESDGFFAYVLLVDYAIARITGMSVSDVPNSAVTIVGESMALIPRDTNDYPIIFPLSTQFVKGTVSNGQ